MAEPKIRYDIEARATGAEDVQRLVAELAKIDDAIDPVAAQRAQELAARLRELGQQQAAIKSFVDLKGKTEEARGALDQAQDAAQKLGRELRSVEQPTRAQAGQMEKLKDAVRDAKVELQAQTGALDNARAGLTRLGLSSDQVATSQGSIRTAMRATAQQADQVTERYQRTAAVSVASSATQVRAQDEVKGALEGLGDQFRKLQSLAAIGIGGGVFGSLVRDVSQTAEAYTNLAARVKLVTGEGAAFDEAFQGVFDVATRTNTAVEETGTLFVRLAEAGKQIGVSQRDALALTESINQAVQISGGSADSAKAAITQLIQGLQSGVLRGEEFNSVMEQSPRLATALAEGLGVTTGELRKMAQQGQLTSETVIGALQGQSAAVAREFEKLPPTVGKSLQNLSTEWTRYVGEVDKANGISQAAATAILALARNLDTVGGLLLDVGQGAAALAAINLAKHFLGMAQSAAAAAAAKTAETAATVANTAAQAANTGAVGANTVAKALNAAATRDAALAQNTATASAGVATGKFAALFKTLKTFSAVGILANAKDIGTAIGEGIASLRGYGDALDETALKARADADASRANTAAKAELAQQLLKAEQATLGLTDASKKLVADFQEVTKKGESVDAAIDKLSKSLQLGNLRGIADAGAALAALGKQGELSAEQVQRAWQQALSGRDLGAFEVQARAAFDNSAQGAERLAAALKGAVAEALRRTGLDVAELGSGISTAAVSALNDFDLLARNVKQLGKEGLDTGRALSVSLNKALEAAATERAVGEVIRRWEELGHSGVVTGERLSEGLEKARRKLDDLKTGINSVDEAMRLFGLKSKAELDRTADNFRQAWEQIRSDATLTLEQKQQAFKRYADAAIAANGGVVSALVKAQAETVKLKVETDDTGKAVVRTYAESEQAAERLTARFKQAGDETRRVGKAAEETSVSFALLTVEATKAGDAMVQAANLGGKAWAAAAAKRNAAVKSELTWEGRKADGSLDPNYVGSSGGSTYTPPPDTSGDWVWQATSSRPGGEWVRTAAATQRLAAEGSARTRQIADAYQQAGIPVPKGGVSTYATQLPDAVRAILAAQGYTTPTGPTGAPGRALTAPAPQAAPAPVAGYSIQITVGGKNFGVIAPDRNTAEGLIRELEEAFRAAGGG